MLSRTLSLVLVAGLLTLPGCDDGAGVAGAPAPDDKLAAGAPAATSNESFAVSVEVPEAAVTVGDAAVLRVTIENRGDEPLRVSVPRIDRNCTTVRVRIGDRQPYVVERLHADIVAGPGGQPQLSWKAPDAKELAAGESLTEDVSLMALEPGEHHVTLSYRRTMNADPVTAAPVKIVVSKDGEKAHAGVTLKTSHGDITVKLRPDVAPNTAESFASLTRAGFFDGLTLHRIVKEFMAQGGDPAGDGSGGPGYFLPLEANGKLKHTRGVLSMARTGLPDTAGSQFFLMFATRPDLDPGFRGGEGYTTFGEMVSGEETLAKLEALETQLSPKLRRMYKERGATDQQLEMAVRSGQIEASSPVETVTITDAEIVTLE